MNDTVGLKPVGLVCGWPEHGTVREILERGGLARWPAETMALAGIVCTNYIFQFMVLFFLGVD